MFDKIPEEQRKLFNLFNFLIAPILFVVVYVVAVAIMYLLYGKIIGTTGFIFTAVILIAAYCFLLYVSYTAFLVIRSNKSSGREETSERIYVSLKNMPKSNTNSYNKPFFIYMPGAVILICIGVIAILNIILGEPLPFEWIIIIIVLIILLFFLIKHILYYVAKRIKKKQGSMKN